MYCCTDGALKWVALWITCLVSFAVYYAFDTPSALYFQTENYFQDKPNQLHYGMFQSLMYILVYVPNIFIPLFASLVVSRLGPCKPLPFVALVLCIGQVIAAVGVQFRIQILALTGRFIFGTMLETLTITKLAIAGMYMQNRVSLGLSISSASNRLGGIVNNFISPLIAERFSLPTAYYAPSALIGIAAVIAIALIPLEKELEKGRIDLAISSRACKVNSREDGCELNTQNQPGKLSFVGTIRRFPLVFWLVILLAGLANTLLYGINSVSKPITFEVLCQGNCCSSNQTTCAKLESLELAARAYTSIPYIMAVIFCPLQGHIIDHIGMSSQFTCLGFMCSLCGTLALLFQKNDVVFGLVFVGLGFAIASSCGTASIAKLVHKQHLATAFACMASLQNIISAGLTFGIGSITSSHSSQLIPASYEHLLWLFIGVSFVGCVLGGVSCYYDFYHGARISTRTHQIIVARAVDNPVCVSTVEKGVSYSGPEEDHDTIYKPSIHIT
uniref:Lysosomal dipeptide transporter MFSD1 n=1 Tax=Mucochytrium quahogii TaxID=96639 RepID=A0A7S2S9L6_9STRA|mmetsp:Transcript_2745/g.5853  ORF Transcript_2745/g.5853 Transcript_2745/m.5853 type:complete len:501 (+) Transcript_2745:1303-2805(+)